MVESTDHIGDEFVANLAFQESIGLFLEKQITHLGVVSLKCPCHFVLVDKPHSVLATHELVLARRPHVVQFDARINFLHVVHVYSVRLHKICEHE